MSFLAPERLLLLIIPVGLIIGYLVSLRRRDQYAVRFTNLELLDKVAPERPGWRRHAPAVALLAALVVVAVATARPVTSVQVPRDEATVVLAIDVSLSMDATDVDPSRIEAAKAAATRFIELAPEGLKIGVVSFAGTAFGVLAPTTDRAEALDAVERLRLGEGTAIGEGIYTSVQLIESTMSLVAEGESVDGPLPEDEEQESPAAIVLLSDGETTMGRPDLDAAQAAVDAEIPVSTVSFGTDAGQVVIQGQVIPVPANNGALEEVADMTGGEFFEAVTGDELQQILDTIGEQVGYGEEDREITDWFAIVALVLLGLAAAGSLRWFSRLP